MSRETLSVVIGDVTWRKPMFEIAGIPGMIGLVRVSAYHCGFRWTSAFTPSI